MLFTFFLSAFAFIKKIIEARKKNYYYYLFGVQQYKNEWCWEGGADRITKSKLFRVSSALILAIC